jgi:hypothetical protein
MLLQALERKVKTLAEAQEEGGRRQGWTGWNQYS